MSNGQEVVLGLTLFCSKTSAEMLEHTRLWKTSAQTPKLLRKLLLFFFLRNSCTKWYVECLNLSGLILSQKNPAFLNLQLWIFPWNVLLFRASFLKPTHLNLKFRMRIVWFIVIKTSKNSESVWMPSLCNFLSKILRCPSQRDLIFTDAEQPLTGFLCALALGQLSSGEGREELGGGELKFLQCRYLNTYSVISY